MGINTTADEELEGYDTELTCCFTGHRDSRLPFGGDRGTAGIRRLQSSIELEMTNLIEQDGVRYFISGMATGIDLMCAEAVCRLKNKYPFIELICVLPYAGHSREMEKIRDQYVHSLMLLASSKNVVLSTDYYKDCYKNRNAYMVRHSGHVIAVFNPGLRYSGTLQTINMAKRAGRDIRMITLKKGSLYYERY